jgi:hypothetical protein
VVCPPSNLVEERTVPWKSVTTKKTSADGKVKEAAKMGFKTRTNCILRAFSLLQPLRKIHGLATIAFFPLLLSF